MKSKVELKGSSHLVANACLDIRDIAQTLMPLLHLLSSYYITHGSLDTHLIDHCIELLGDIESKSNFAYDNFEEEDLPF